MEQNCRNSGFICSLCNGAIQDPISKPCGHSFCLNCLFKYRALKGNVGGSCPSCIYRKETNKDRSCQTNLISFYEDVSSQMDQGESLDVIYLDFSTAFDTVPHKRLPLQSLQPLQPMPLQLISVDENGLLNLNEAVLRRCFLRGGIEEYPVFLISVIGEGRTGKSFLMNYIMKALHIQESTNRFDLGAEDEILEGFSWKPGPDTVTKGIWIWTKPFILGLNGQKIAVFLMDMEGSMDICVDRKSNIKMCMLTMLLSSHLVYNVSSTIKETDIDYLEIYCHGLGSDKLHNLKYFDFLIRNWYDAKMCGVKHGESHYKVIIEKMKKKYKDCTFLEVLKQCSSKCFLMPYPGDKITSEDTGRLKDMNKEFQESLRIYLSGVVRRVLSSIGSANSENTLSCSDMALKISTEFLPYINKMKYNISSPSEMLIMKENLETMQKIKNEFQDFLQNWSIWKLKIGNQVADKISELLQRFETSYRRINDEDYEEQLEKLRTYLVTEGDKFCRRHNIKLCLHGITAVAGMAAVPLVGAFAAAPAAAAAGTFTLQSVGAWFGYQAAAPVAASAFSTSSIIGGATAVMQVGVAMVRRFI
ncbi:RING finger protein 112-like isoform X2 [Dendrobates tinctorius]|uniref:RING finger protein 112-like isoform X2 n=1 Tax=Dendrobates tinctorius TaxID=92724 RepID=UPI003CC9B324